MCGRFSVVYFGDVCEPADFSADGAADERVVVDGLPVFVEYTVGFDFVE